MKANKINIYFCLEEYLHIEVKIQTQYKHTKELIKEGPLINRQNFALKGMNSDLFHDSYRKVFLQ